MLLKAGIQKETTGVTVHKRQELINTAFKLFYQNGIHAVGINQILKESGIAKKTLYHHFASKEQLLLAVINYRDKVFLEWFISHIKAADPGLPAIEAIFDALDDWFNNRAEALTQFQGCFFINTCAEFGDLSHQAHQMCAEHKQRIEDLVREQVDQLPIETGHKELTQTICQLKEGAIVQAHIQGDLGAAKRSKGVAGVLVGVVG